MRVPTLLSASRHVGRLRAPAAGALAAVLLAACGGVPAPEDVDECEGLVEVGVDWVERTAEALHGQPFEVVTGTSGLPEDLEELREIGVAIDTRSAELGCHRSELQAAIVAGTSELESDDPVVSLFLAVVRGEELEPAP